MSTTRSRIIASAAAVAVAAFLPWVSIFGISVAGTKGDGQITLALAIVGIVLALARPVGRWVRRVQLALAGLVAFVALYHLGGAAAIGVYLTLLAGGAWAVIAWRSVPPVDAV